MRLPSSHQCLVGIMFVVTRLQDINQYDVQGEGNALGRRGRLNSLW